MDSTTRIPLHTGRRMPVLGLGTWQLTKDTPATIEAALGLGYRMIDTAVDYGSQPGIGEGIRRSLVDRAETFVVTKIEESDEPYQAVQRDLDELQLDYADLTLIHRPPPTGAGEALWEGLIRAREDGLAKDIGISNYSAKLTDALIAATGETPTVNQIQWSPFGHSNEMLRHATERKIVIQAYSPLTRTRRLDDPTLSEIAASHGKSPAQILIRWNLQRGTVPLPKANRREHLEEDIDVFAFALGDNEMAALGRLNERYSSLGSLPYA